MFVVIMLIFLVVFTVGGLMGYLGFKMQEEDEHGPRVAITAEMRACKTDADCVRANAACNGCCGETAIARAQEKPFYLLFGRTCKGTRIMTCDCRLGPQRLACRKSGCVLEDIPRPAANPE
jgi:hypothetical protein